MLDEWAAALRAAGISQIDGRIIGDDQLFDDEGIGPGWAWDYLQFGYAAPVGALQFNENLATLTVRPAAQAGDPADGDADARRRPDAPQPRRDRSPPDRRGRSTTAATSISRCSRSPARSPRAPRRSSATVAVVNPTIFFAQSLEGRR